MFVRRLMELDAEQLNSKLTVESRSGRTGRITGNPHTHPGRFSVLWDDGDAPTPISLAELSDASPEARLWLAGFLSGQGPHPLEIVPHGADFMSKEDTATWAAVHREFEKTGTMPELWRKNRAAFEEL